MNEYPKFHEINKYGREDWFLNEFGLILHNTHPKAGCVGPTCVLHKPSDHHMRDWPVRWDSFLTRTCSHGCEHPDPDSVAFAVSMGNTLTCDYCDGCCDPPHGPTTIFDVPGYADHGPDGSVAIV